MISRTQLAGVSTRPSFGWAKFVSMFVTGYVPAELYYDVRIKLMEQMRHDRKAKTDFPDLLREWMEQWLAKQP